MISRARRTTWIAAALASALLGALGLAVAIVPDVWTRQFTQDPEVLASTAVYFLWAGPSYALFGLGLCLYFSSLGAGKVGGLVLAGTLRFVLIAVGGWILAAMQAPPWTIFALVALGMAAYGLASVVAMRYTPWGIDRCADPTHSSARSANLVDGVMSEAPNAPHHLPAEAGEARWSWSGACAGVRGHPIVARCPTRSKALS